MPLRKRTREELRQKLFSGNWRLREWRIFQEQFGDRELFETLMSALRDPAPPNGLFHDQDHAGKILLALNPKCHWELKAVIRETLPHWNLSVEEIPFYLANQFGKQAVLEAVAELAEEFAGRDIHRGLSTYRFWLRA